MMNRDDINRGRRRGGRRGFAGFGGYCICPNCHEKVEHRLGIPCRSVSCPKCGTMMTRV